MPKVGGGRAKGAARRPGPGPSSRLARDSHIALYRQIAEWLEGEIAEGRLAPQARLEPEHALMRRFGVSRITVRQAIHHLAERGLILRKQGKGTFVAGPAAPHEPQDPRGFFEILLSQGPGSEARLLRFGAEVPPAEAARALGLEPGEQAVGLERLYLRDGEPVAVAESWLTPEARRVSWADAESHSTHSILQNLLGIQIARTDIGVRSAFAGRALRRQLKLPSHVPMLVLTRVSCDVQGTGLEFTRFAVNSESDEFTLSARGAVPVRTVLKPTAAVG